MQCSFTAIRSDRQYRPPRVTPKPLIRGPQTAIVAGKSGEEIWTDEYGRIKVQFHWDRYGEGDENASCWVRVAQPSSGKSWGGLFTPRIGHEVIVEFLEGDPDRPIVTGSVYNGQNMPPYELPANATLVSWGAGPLALDYGRPPVGDRTVFKMLRVERWAARGVTHVVRHNYPLPYSSATPPERTPHLERLAVFDPFAGELRDPVFEPLVAFYLPLARFHGVERPGPRIEIYALPGPN